MKKLVLLFGMVPMLLFPQHTVSGVFSPAEDFTYAFLYQATPTGAEYVNRGQLAEDGSFSITLDSSATAGIYKIIYALPPEDNNFDLIYNGKESVAFNFSLENGLEFTRGNDNKLWASYTKSMDMVNNTLSNFYAQKSADKTAFAEIIKTMSDTQNAYEESAEGTLAAVFIKANRPYIPDGYENLSTYAKNLKAHYLTHVDFSNKLLQSSDFLVDRVMAFVFGMTANSSNATYKTDIDHLVKSMGDSAIGIKTILLEQVWRRFTTMNNSELANYVADTYLMALSQQTGYDALTQEMTAYKNNAIGRKALNFELSYTQEGQTVDTNLHDLDTANEYVLVFWSSRCSHCLDELPKLRDYLADKPELQVIAFGMEDDADNWQHTITEFPGFIHVLGLGKWDNPTADAYGISATPTYFLLDNDKTIIGKPDDLAALKKILD